MSNDTFEDKFYEIAASFRATYQSVKGLVHVRDGHKDVYIAITEDNEKIVGSSLMDIVFFLGVLRSEI